MPWQQSTSSSSRAILYPSGDRSELRRKEPRGMAKYPERGSETAAGGRARRVAILEFIHRKKLHPCWMAAPGTYL